MCASATPLTAALCLRPERRALDNCLAGGGSYSSSGSAGPQKHFKLEGQSYAAVGESRHLVLFQNSAFWASRKPRIGVEVCCSESLLQANMPGHHPMIRTAAVLNSEIQSAVCCGSSRINARQSINVTILSAAEGQIIWGVRSPGCSAVADRHRYALSHLPVAPDLDC